MIEGVRKLRQRYRRHYSAVDKLARDYRRLAQIAGQTMEDLAAVPADIAQHVTYLLGESPRSNAPDKPNNQGNTRWTPSSNTSTSYAKPPRPSSTR